MAIADDHPPAWNDPRNPRVCFCWRVHRSELQRLVRQGARTLDDLAVATRAGTGCGTCRSDLLAILRDAADERGSGS